MSESDVIIMAAVAFAIICLLVAYWLNEDTRARNGGRTWDSSILVSFADLFDAFGDSGSSHSDHSGDGSSDGGGASGDL